MSIRDDFFAAKTKGSLWDVAVSIKRGNPLPLDADSIFESYSALETYANDVLAYPGQLVAVVAADKTDIYYLDQNLAIKPVGIIPSGDSKTIEVTSEGAISLLGSASAGKGTLPVVDEVTVDGEKKLQVVWKTLEDIGAGDGNDNTTYTFAFADQKITVTPSENGVAKTPVVLDLSEFVTATELSNALDDYFNTRDKDTTYSVVSGEKVINLNGTEFSSVLKLAYSTTNSKIQLLGINDDVVSELDASMFVADGILEDVSYDANADKLLFTWNTIDSATGEKKKVEVDVSDLVDTYSAGNGLNLDDHTFSVDVDDTTETFLSVGANGIKLSGVQSAIDTAKQGAIDDAATKYATKQFVGEIPTGYTETNVIGYINKKAQEVLDSATGGSSESAASVKQQLDTYKAANDPKVNALLSEVYGSPAEDGTYNYTAPSRIDNLEAVGAQANVIEEIQRNGVKITPTGKVVNIEVPTNVNQLTGYTTLDDRITTAKNQADKGVSDAAAAQSTADNNTNRIASLETKVSGEAGLEAAKADHERRIAILEKYDTDNSAAIEALETLVSGKADTSVVTGISERLGAAEGNITSLTGRVSANETAISNKAEKTSVYTKEEIDLKTGTIPTDKTLVGMISDVSSTMSTSYATKASVEAIYKAGAEGVDATGVLADEIARAKAAEKANSDAINTASGKITTLIGSVEGDDAKSVRTIASEETAKIVANADSKYDTLKEIADWIASDTTGAAKMNADILANTTNIGKNTTAIGTNATNIGKNTTAIDIINGKLAGVETTVSDLITSKLEAAALKASAEVTITDGVLGLGTVSTDKLVQGTDTLVLNGGNA